MPRDMFEAVIGLEIHAQIATKSKLFCTCSGAAFEAEPNEHVCPICMGFPGQLPVMNEDALRKGVKAALALHCSVPGFSKFDRKNYFYPDLPKGYQISQFDEPLALAGWLEINVQGENKKVRITRLHLEDDAGKLTHVDNGTLCDYNRSGIPLMEIVSEPDMHTSAEAGAYARSMQTILRYVGASDADMEKGMMRFDASVSIRPKGEDKLYNRAEIKNLNSFRSLESAIDYEIERQIFLWEEGKPLEKNITVGWSDDHEKTYFMRDKEGADDYRYFPEPDLPPLVVTPEMLEEIQKEVPELPTEKRERYESEWKVSEAEAILLSSELPLAQYFEQVVAATDDPKKAATFIATILMSHLKKEGTPVEECKITVEMLSKLISMVNDGKISMNIAKGDVFEDMFENGTDPEVIVNEKGLAQVSDPDALKKVCEEVIAENAQSIEDYKSGKKQAFFYLVGQVMKKTKGAANAQMVTEMLEKLVQ